MHNISNLFYSETTLYMFRMERPSETCRVLFQNKINLRYCASGWFYCRNIFWCTVLHTSNVTCYGHVFFYKSDIQPTAKQTQCSAQFYVTNKYLVRF